MLFFNLKTYFNIDVMNSNVIIVLSNVMMFMIAEFCFFWFIVSKSVEGVIDSKIDLLLEMDRQLDWIELNKIEIEQSTLDKAKDDESNRYEQNILLAQTLLGPFAIVIGSLWCLSILVMIVKKIPFTKTDFLLLCTIFLAFSTELIFYFIVIERSKIIGDMIIIKLIIGTVQKTDLELFLKNMFLSLFQLTLPPGLTFPPSFLDSTFPPSLPDATFPPFLI